MATSSVSSTTILGVHINTPAFMTGDLGFILIFFGIFFFITSYFGRGMIVSLILSFYVSSLVYLLFPFTSKLIFLKGDLLILINNLIIFLVILIPVTIIINRYMSSGDYMNYLGFFKITLFSIASLVLLVSLSYIIINYDLLHDFSPQVDALYALNGVSFFIFLLPIIVLVFL